MRIQSTLLLLVCLLPSCSGTGGSSTSSNNQITATAPAIPSAGQPRSQTVTAGQTASVAGIDRQDYNSNSDTTERIPLGAYITGSEQIGHAWTTP